MHSFSNKSKSQPITKKTLDIHHTHKMQQFQEKERYIQELKHKIPKLKKELLELEKNENNILRIIELNDKISSCEKQLESLNINNEEIDYLVNIGDTLFKYYDIIDKGDPDDLMFLHKNTNVENSILKYLISKEDKETQNNNNYKDINDKASLLDKYMEFTENNYIKNVKDIKHDKCSACNSLNRNIMLTEGIIYCNDCNTIEYIIIDHDRPSYKDPPILLWAKKWFQNMKLLVLMLLW